jgi:hypothetical protein
MHLGENSGLHWIALSAALGDELGSSLGILALHRWRQTREELGKLWESRWASLTEHHWVSRSVSS